MVNYYKNNIWLGGGLKHSDTSIRRLNNCSIHNEPATDKKRDTIWYPSLFTLSQFCCTDLVF